MGFEIPFDPLERFAGIERLAAKVYFRSSPLFIARSTNWASFNTEVH